MRKIGLFSAEAIKGCVCVESRHCNPDVICRWRWSIDILPTPGVVFSFELGVHTVADYQLAYRIRPTEICGATRALEL